MRDTRPPGGAGGAERGGFAIGSAAFLDQPWPGLGTSEQPDVFPLTQRDTGKKLDDIIAGEIVPRLMLLHQRREARGKGADTPLVNMSSQVADFADLVIHHEISVADAYVKYLQARGLDLETLLLHLLAPAARKLGELWEEDKIDFVEVTVATSRLQHLLHKLTFPLRNRENEANRQLLLVPAPEEQHSFGLVMVSEFFMREGWQVHGVAPLETDELFSLISERWFAVIGFSLSCDRLIETLCSSIQAVRRISKNKSVRIMVGGRVFAQAPDLRPSVGADLVASDAREAVVLAESALRMSLSR